MKEKKWIIKRLVHKARVNSATARRTNSVAQINWCLGKKEAYMYAAKLIKYTL